LGALLRTITLALAAATTLAATGCWARVPSSFDPPPPRLDSGGLAVNDLRDREIVTLLALGDGGTGTTSQFEVGRQMARICEARDCDLAVTLGDNFYERGVSPPRDGVWDEAFVRMFEAPYQELGAVQFWAVTGNHDWYGGRDSVDTMIAYSTRSDRWRMPSYDYAIPRLPAWLTIYALDTAVLLADADIGQLERASETLCDAPGWRLVTGHHPIYSSGMHGGPGGRNPRAAAALLPLLERCDVDIYLAGHEHHQEHLRTGDLHHIIQGAAGRVRSVAAAGANRAAQSLFTGARFGFAILEITRQEIAVDFYGYPPGDPAAFGLLYRARITSRRPATATPR